MTKDNSRKKAIHKLVEILKLSSYSQGALVYDANACAFCQALLKQDKDGMYKEEVGEFWSKTLQDTVMAHPDCLPLGIDNTIMGKDPEWSMA